MWTLLTVTLILLSRAEGSVIPQLRKRAQPSGAIGVSSTVTSSASPEATSPALLSSSGWSQSVSMSSLSATATASIAPAASATNTYFDLSPDVWEKIGLSQWLDDFVARKQLASSTNFLHDFTQAAGLSAVDYALNTPTAPEYTQETIESLPKDEYNAYYLLQAFKVYNQWMYDLMSSFTDAMGDMSLAVVGITNDWVDRRPAVPFANPDVKLGQMLNSAAMLAFLVPAAPVQILGAVTIIVGSILEKEPDLLGPNMALNFDDFADAGAFGNWLLNIKQKFRDSLTSFFQESMNDLTTFKQAMQNGKWMQSTNVIANTDTVTNGFVKLWTQQMIAQIMQNQGVYLMRQSTGFDGASTDSCHAYAASVGSEWFCLPDDQGTFHAYQFRISVANNQNFREYDELLPYDPIYLPYTQFASPTYSGGTSKVGLDLGQVVKTSEEVFAVNPYLKGDLWTPWDTTNQITLNPHKYLNSDVSSQWNIPICDVSTMLPQCNWALRRHLSTMSFIDPNNPACDDGAQFRNRTGWYCDSMVNTFTYDKSNFRTIRVPDDAWANL